MADEVIRAYMLEPGDVFQISHTDYLVVKIEKGTIYSRYLSCSSGKEGGYITMGSKSQERVLLITNKTNKNGNQNQSNHFS